MSNKTLTDRVRAVRVSDAEEVLGNLHLLRNIFLTRLKRDRVVGAAALYNKVDALVGEAWTMVEKLKTDNGRVPDECSNCGRIGLHQCQGRT